MLNNIGPVEPELPKGFVFVENCRAICEPSAGHVKVCSSGGSVEISLQNEVWLLKKLRLTAGTVQATKKNESFFSRIRLIL